MDIRIITGLFVRKGDGDPYKDYELVNFLGGGGYGKVYRVKHRLTGTHRAMKIITVKSTSKDQINTLSKEINILKELDHPHIIKVFEFYTNKHNFYIITELCTGGELFDKIIEVKHFSEVEASNIILQILRAVNYLHSNGVIHRDLKPENIMIESNEERNKEFFNIKLIDFGTSDILKRNKMLKKQIGTSFYIAPDVLKNSYNEKCDLWSCGVILFILLSGTPPFYGLCEDDIYQKIIYGNYSFKNSIWSQISNKGKDLIKKLLEIDPVKRLSAREAMEHPWFKSLENNKQMKDISNNNLLAIIKNISEFRAEQKLQQATLAFLVHNLPSHEDISDLKEVFLAFDVNNDGRLTKDELELGMSKILNNSSSKNQDVDLLMRTIDSDNNGYIEFEEFLSASIDKEKLCTEKNLQIAFDWFDKDKSGGISLSELKHILGESNVNTKDEVWKEMIKEIDSNCDGQISFDEFKEMMLKVVYSGKSNNGFNDK